MNRVLIIGLGSIGHKHMKALVNIGVKDIAALRTGLGQKNPENDIYLTLKEFYSTQDALNWKPTHFIISNPTGLHIDFINIAIANNIKFFVEKPIADCIDDLNRISDLNTKLGFVGYNLRFNPIFMRIKEIIDSNKYGDIITAKLHVGQYLPSWHPYEDYSKAYYSRKDMGGGALRTLSHEIDLIQFFFGKVRSVFSTVERLSNLNIDVDDVVNISTETDKCKRVNIHINYLDPILDRSGTLYFTDGIIKYDYLSSTLTYIYNSGEKEVLISGSRAISDQYTAQMNAFINNMDKDYSCSFTEGTRVMIIINACEESTIKKKEICLV